MNFFKKLGLFSVMVVAVAACTSTGYKLSDSVSDSMQGQKDAATSYQRSGKATLSSLDALVAEPHKDIPDRFKAFSERVDGLESAKGDVTSAAANTDSAAKSRLAAWDKENAALKDEAMRTQAQNRRNDVNASYMKTKSVSDEAASAVVAYTARVSELRKVLSNDLTPASLESAKSIASELHEQFETLSETLDSCNKELEAGRQFFSSGPKSVN